MSITPESQHIKQQLDLLRLRRQALRIALLLFESAISQEEIARISNLFEQSNIAEIETSVQDALDELNQLASAKNLPIDL